MASVLCDTSLPWSVMLMQRLCFCALPGVTVRADQHVLLGFGAQGPVAGQGASRYNILQGVQQSCPHKNSSRLPWPSW